MNSSLLSHLHARQELFRKGQLVYLRKPEEETDDNSRNALSHLREQIGSGPFRALRITDTPSSKAASQRITLANEGSDTSLQTEGGPLELSGYYLSSELQ